MVEVSRILRFRFFIQEGIEDRLNYGLNTGR